MNIPLNPDDLYTFLAEHEAYDYYALMDMDSTSNTPNNNYITEIGDTPTKTEHRIDETE